MNNLQAYYTTVQLGEETTWDTDWTCHQERLSIC